MAKWLEWLDGGIRDGAPADCEKVSAMARASAASGSGVRASQAGSHHLGNGLLCGTKADDGLFDFSRCDFEHLQTGLGHGGDRRLGPVPSRGGFTFCA